MLVAVRNALLGAALATSPALAQSGPMADDMMQACQAPRESAAGLACSNFLYGYHYGAALAVPDDAHCSPGGFDEDAFKSALQSLLQLRPELRKESVVVAASIAWVTMTGCRPKPPRQTGAPGFELVMTFAVVLNADQGPIDLSDLRTRLYFQDREQCEQARPGFERSYGREVEAFLREFFSQRSVRDRVKVEVQSLCRRFSG